MSRDLAIARDKGKGKMENRPAGARTGKNPVSGSGRQNDEPARRSSDRTPLPDEKAPDWAALGSTRVVPGMADAAAVEAPASEAGPDGKQPSLLAPQVVNQLLIMRGDFRREVSARDRSRLHATHESAGPKVQRSNLREL